MIDHAAVGIDLHHILEDIQFRIEHDACAGHAGVEIEGIAHARFVGVPAGE